MKNIKHLSVILILFLFLVFSVIPAFAQDQEYGTSYQPIRKVDMGAASLTLEVGEKYTFSVSFDPESPPVTQLIWFNTDNTVAAVNQLTNTVTALAPGTAWVMAESFDKEAWAVCEITVSGNQEKDLSGMVEGKTLLTLSVPDRAKIKASQINRYLDLMEISVFNQETIQKLQDQSMRVMAEVRPGAEEAESSRALALGMTGAYPMKNLHLVSLHGSFAQILDFVKENEDLIRIFKGHDIYFFGPHPETGSSPLLSKTAQSTNAMMLEGKVEELTSVSTIHNMGYTGRGITIAVLDTGLNPEHEQFAGRVIREHCYSYSYQCKPIPGCEPCSTEDVECNIKKCYDCDNFISACEGGSVENSGQSDSALPHPVKDWSEFDHGSHVTGIAAGKNGMAPGANIVAVQIQSELFDPAYITETNPDGYSTTLWDHDMYSAYDWLLDIQKILKAEGKPVSILNLSLGGGKFVDYCDASDTALGVSFDVFRKLNEAGILPVAAAGNEKYDDEVNLPACFSNVIAVGALTNMNDPYIADYSNHGRLVDILAPGSEIRSAYLVEEDEDDDDEEEDSVDKEPCKDCYDHDSGTSMATPMVSGSLALLMEAFPDLDLWEYKTKLIEMSTKTADKRDPNKTGIDQIRKFDYAKPVLDFSNFKVPEPEQPEEPGSSRSMEFYQIADIFGLYGMPKTGFSALHPQNLTDQPLSVQYKPTSLTIQLPELDVRSDIVTVPFVDREFPVEWLGDSVGMLEGSSLPGEGITFLTGHNHLNTTEAGPFAFLFELEAGDRIMITGQQGIMQIWQVYENMKVPAGGFGSIAGDVKENSLVLITCEDESVDGGYLNRRLILAEPSS